MVPNRAYFSHVPLTLSEFQWAAAEGSIGGLVLGFGGNLCEWRLWIGG